MDRTRLDAPVARSTNETTHSGPRGSEFRDAPTPTPSRSAQVVDRSVYTRRRLLVTSALFAVPFAAWRVTRRDNSEQAIMSLPDTPSPVIATSGEPRAGATQPPSPATTVPNTPPLGHDIGPGMTGAEVRAVQDRLRALAFDPGPSDGVFGPATERAVWAFEKFVLDTPASEVSGIVTAPMWEQMNTALDVRPRRANPGNHIEILLPQQVAVVYSDDVPVLITHVSSGSGEEWCSVVLVDEDDGTQTEQGICGRAVTPGGVFHIERRIDGWRNSKLGRLYNPLYFNYGIALHGATKVPKYPASRGCVRLPMHIAEYFPTLLANGDLVYVFDGVEQPETYGAQLPVFDWADPNYTTTSTTSTTTVPQGAGAATTAPPTSSTHPHPAAEPAPETTAPPPSGTVPIADGSSGVG